MSFTSLAQAAQIYECAENLVIEPLEVTYSPFCKFATSLKQFRSRLGEAGTQDFWMPVLRSLRAYQFNINSTPLSFSSPAMEGAQLLADARSALRHCPQVYPDFAESAERLLEEMVSLAQIDANPLFETIRYLLGGHPRVSVALAMINTRAIVAVESLMSTHAEFAEVELLSPIQLRGPGTFDHLVVVGPAHWYPDHVMTSPRARIIHVLRYACIRDYWKPSPAFPGIRTPHSWRWQPRLTRRQHETEDRVEAELPELDVQQVMRSRHFQEQRARHEEVLAQVLRLAGHEAVFVDADSTIDVIDLERDDDSPVRRAALPDITPGMFVLLRTEGGGDYIVSVADEILGERAAEYRAMQREWKTRLQAVVAERGLLNVALALLTLGGELANEQNVARWMSYRSIKTHDRRDFRAVMSLVGLEMSGEHIWQVMEQIDSAHRKAGFKIASLLRQEVGRANLWEMEKRGRMDFVLPGVDAGRLTAFRVEDVLRDRHPVPASLLLRPFDEHRLTWRE